jgi:hypothetical protein
VAAVDSRSNASLPRPTVRCITSREAAAYRGIGVTLLDSLGVPVVRFGRRLVYDRMDLDAWLDAYKARQRGTAASNTAIDATTSRNEGDLVADRRISAAYVQALGLNREGARKRSRLR